MKSWPGRKLVMEVFGLHAVGHEKRYILPQSFGPGRDYHERQETPQVQNRPIDRIIVEAVTRFPRRAYACEVFLYDSVSGKKATGRSRVNFGLAHKNALVNLAKAVRPPQDDRPVVTLEQAKALLDVDPKGNCHSFIGGGFALLGADVDVSKIYADAKKYGIQLAGERMANMDHGLVIVSRYKRRDVATFYATKRDQRATLKDMGDQYKRKHNLT